MSDKKKKDNFIVKLRNDIFITKDNIDIILKTDRTPDGKNLDKESYLVYLKNSKYNWVLLSDEEFENNIKQHIF